MSERTSMIAEAAGHWALAWSLVVLAVAIAMRLARPRRTSVRYGGWLLATFAGLVLLPIVAIGPRLSWNEISFRFRSLPKSTTAALPLRSWFEGSRVGTALDRVIPKVGETDRTPVATGGTGSKLPARASSGESRSRSGDRLLGVVIGVWVVGLVVFLARLVGSAWSISRMLAKLSPQVPDGLALELTHACRELGVWRRVRIATHPDILAPMCVGLLRPVILWPTAANCPMTALQQRASLTHEVGHLRRGDDWVALMAELWRAASWFYLPVHYTVACLRREREYLCDDLAACKMETPERYARWLLDLTPVQVSPPLLSASFLGGAGLVGRVRRIVEGELKWARPITRRHAVILSLVAVLILGGAGSVRLVGFLGRASAQQVDGPLPDISIKELAEKMRASWERYDKGYLELKFVETFDMNRHTNGKNAKLEEQAPHIVERPGRVQFASDGRCWKVEYDSKMPNSNTGELVSDRWAQGFDGHQRYDWHIDRNLVTLGESSGMEDQWRPQHKFWGDQQRLHETLVAENPAKLPIVIRQTIVNGVACYLVESVFKSNGEWKSEYVISPRHGFLPIRISFSHDNKKYSTKEMHDLKESEPGLWFPGRIETERLTRRANGESRVASHDTIRVITYDPQRRFTGDSFQLPIPDDIDVTDRHLGYSYHTDPWWPEVGFMLRERFNWPEADLDLLNNLGTTSPASIEGTPAPAIQAEKWIDSGPVDLAKLRGKVVLLLFWSHRWTNSPAVLVPLRRIEAIYKPAGLEIVTVHSPTDEFDELSRFIKEYKLTWPVAIDSKDADGVGVTHKAFSVEGEPCAILIDREGKLHSIGQGGFERGQLVEKLVPLLNAVEGVDAKVVALSRPELSNEMRKAMGNFFSEKVGEALKTDLVGQISGRVLDGDGQPIAGASVSATLNFYMLMSASPGGYLMHPYRARVPRFSTITDKDGNYKLNRLCKGTFIIKAQSQGRAWHEERATISTDMKPAMADFRLDENDTISGVVRDEFGQPIAGAKVQVTQRKQILGNHQIRYDSVQRDLMITDAVGRFVISDLQTGRYTFEITAPDYLKSNLEGVPAGSVNAAVVLKRAAK